VAVNESKCYRPTVCVINGGTADGRTVIVLRFRFHDEESPHSAVHIQPSGSDGYELKLSVVHRRSDRVHSCDTVV